MADMKDKHREVFREEAYELLSELEQSLLELEERPEDLDLVSRVFRALHTIKGSGSMFGFDDIAAFAHEVESVFDLVRNGKMAVTKELIDLALACRDHIRRMLDASVTGEFVDEAQAEKLASALRVMVPREDAGAAPGERVEAKAAAAPGAGDYAYASTYRISFRPPEDLFLKGVNPLFLLEDLRGLGLCYVVAQTKKIPPLRELNPDRCYTYWDVILTTDRGLDAVRDVFIFVEDEDAVKIEVIDEGGEISEEGDYKKLGEILVERGDITTGDLVAALGKQRRLGELLVDSGLVEGGQVESALAEQSRVKELRRERQTREAASTIRVPSAKLDSLVDLVGELVTVQARLTQKSVQSGDPELLSIAEEVERLTAELHDNSMSVRMVPIGSTFSKFKRLVRDLSADLGRQVALSTSGAETEMDKTVIERLNDPLVHLIRNSIDHGVEPPDVRVGAGKPAQGTIHLSAEHSGANVLIRVSDDGAGLNAAAIRARATDRGLIAPEAEMSEAELYNLIFLPGFSTAKKVTGVSGRGVGMDVVKRSVDALRGEVEIESKKGRGTTVTLRIPLTLVIVEGLLVKLAGSFFVIPLSAVEECVELTRADVGKAHGRHLVNVRGELVPYIPLRERFAADGDPPAIQQVAIVRAEGQRIGLAVDQVVGGHQTVIKGLGKVYRDVEGVSGATIMGDGTVALIIDVPKLVQGAELEERESVKDM